MNPIPLLLYVVVAVDKILFVLQAVVESVVESVDEAANIFADEEEGMSLRRIQDLSQALKSQRPPMTSASPYPSNTDRNPIRIPRPMASKRLFGTFLELILTVEMILNYKCSAKRWL